MTLQDAGTQAVGPAACALCRFAPAEFSVHVFDPALRVDLRGDWSYVCLACRPMLDGVVASMMREDSRLIRHVFPLGLGSMVSL